MDNRFIMLVEDNPDDEALTMRALRNSNMLNDIVVARNGAEALDYLFGKGSYTGRDTSILPELVLLDLKLPKINGLDVLKRIRADGQTKRLPVVILTSSKEERDLIDGYDSGANSYICKPVDFTQFGKSIQQLGLYWLVLNVGPPKPRSEKTADD